MYIYIYISIHIYLDYIHIGIYLDYFLSLSLSLSIYIYIYEAIALMSRVFANSPGDQGSIPGRIISKSQKMVLDAAFLTTIR